MSRLLIETVDLSIIVLYFLDDTIGGSAIYSKQSPLDLHLCDMQTACQHLCGQTKGLEGVGALLLGSEASRHPVL